MKTFIASFILLCSVGLTAQTIKGKVIDENDAPVIFAAVTLNSPKDSSLVKATITADFGIFEFEGILPDSYVLKISNIGFAEYSKTIDFKGDEFTKFSI